jgi:uncharacterized protein (TIGR02246 family)
MRGGAAAIVLAAAVVSAAPVERLAPRDESRIRAVNEAYAAGWRANDPDAVRATFWPDAVLIPQGGAPIRGMDAINRFWWPAGGPATTVTAFTVTTDEVRGSGAMAFTRGGFRLDFSYEENGKKVERTNRGNYMNVFSRDSRGTWRISHRMWGDLPRSP